MTLEFQEMYVRCSKVLAWTDYRSEARIYSCEALEGLNQRPLRAIAQAKVRASIVRQTRANQNGASFSPAIEEQRRKSNRNKNCTWKSPRSNLPNIACTLRSPQRQAP